MRTGAIQPENRRKKKCSTARKNRCYTDRTKHGADTYSIGAHAEVKEGTQVLQRVPLLGKGVRRAVGLADNTERSHTQLNGLARLGGLDDHTSGSDRGTSARLGGGSEAVWVCLLLVD